MKKDLKRISVDFNTLTSEPVDLVKIGQVGTPWGPAATRSGRRAGAPVGAWA